MWGNNVLTEKSKKKAGAEDFGTSSATCHEIRK
jgi:hypothetical protein